MEADLSGFNIDAPRWDQRTFLGRVKHFLNITDPRTVFVSERELDWAKDGGCAPRHPSGAAAVCQEAV
ncbi:SFXN2 isoform 12 [Pan troglodytes]|uniref:Sideroflexin 2 n=2 Tax=Homininae TaxID=207598 RepID=R4GMS6_HUMAN|nr:sideroflexin 2 [Homo sapiens]KAI4077296.1 sideroflexin 2 [Homo sapiens]PNI81871.1 SFXN2 isoform 12 [Pan troglodytes]